MSKIEKLQDPDKVAERHSKEAEDLAQGHMMTVADIREKLGANQELMTKQVALAHRSFHLAAKALVSNHRAEMVLIKAEWDRANAELAKEQAAS